MADTCRTTSPCHASQAGGHSTTAAKFTYGIISLYMSMALAGIHVCQRRLQRGLDIPLPDLVLHVSLPKMEG
jgi:hypothetical protein